MLMTGFQPQQKRTLHVTSKSQIDLLALKKSSQGSNSGQTELKVSDLNSSRKIIPSISMNRVKLIPPSNNKTTKPYRYNDDHDNSSSLTIGPSPGKEVHETIESPEQQSRQQIETEIRGKSPPLKHFYPRYLQKKNNSAQLVAVVQQIVSLRMQWAFNQLKKNNQTGHKILQLSKSAGNKPQATIYNELTSSIQSLKNFRAEVDKNSS